MNTLWFIRNYDITASPLNQVQYSPYVNGTLYTYYLFEDCLDTAGPRSGVAGGAGYWWIR